MELLLGFLAALYVARRGPAAGTEPFAWWICSAGLVQAVVVLLWGRARSRMILDGKQRAQLVFQVAVACDLAVMAGLVLGMLAGWWWSYAAAFVLTFASWRLVPVSSPVGS